MCGAGHPLGAVSDELDGHTQERWRPTRGSNWSAEFAPPLAARAASLHAELGRAASSSGGGGGSGGGHFLQARINQRCEAFALLRPRRPLQRMLQPVLASIGTGMRAAEPDALHGSTSQGGGTTQGGTGTLVGVHMRTGFSDWQALASRTHASAAAWQRATEAARLPQPYDVRWRRFEAMFVDCASVAPADALTHAAVRRADERVAYARRADTRDSGGTGTGTGASTSSDEAELVSVRAGVARTACFEWPRHAAPTLEDGLRCKPRTRRRSQYRRRGRGHERSIEHSASADASAEASFSLQVPSNGTLAAVLTCATGFASGHSSASSASSHSSSGQAWRLLVLGDSPALISLALGHPQLGPSRVVHTSSAGVIGHTAFSWASSTGALAVKAAGMPRRAAESSPAGSDASSQTLNPTPMLEPTHDPSGAWSRSMVDLYAAGLCDGFVSALFSSFVGAALSRSVLCCAGAGRAHFMASPSTAGSNRDHAMTNASVLAALM